MWSCPLREILKSMMPHDQPRLLRAHPHARHPRVTIRINEVNIPRDEHVLVVRAARCQDENAQKSDFDDAEDSANHSTNPNAGWAIRNSILRTCQRGRALLNQRVELVEINRFYQVMLEPGLLTLTNVLFHPETRESDCHQRLIWGELSYQLDSISIGQSKIADQHIKLLICAKINRRPKIQC